MRDAQQADKAFLEAMNKYNNIYTAMTFDDQPNDVRIAKKLPERLKYNLKNNDLYYLCLRYLNINDKQISSLLGLTYSAVRKKRNKMKDIVVDLVKLTM